MKAKLVKYPFNEKKYRWDTYKAGREFQYTWDESLPKNFNRLDPFIKYKQVDNEEGKLFGYVNLATDPTTHQGAYRDLVNYQMVNGVKAPSQKVKSNWFITDEYDLTNLFENYYQMRYGAQFSKIHPYVNQAPSGTGTYISSCVFGLINYIYEETSSEIILKLQPLSADASMNEYWNRPDCFDWVNKTNRSYSLSSAEDLQLVANLIKQEKGFTKNVRWEKTYETGALYVLAYNYEKNSLPYEYPENHYPTWTKHTLTKYVKDDGTFGTGGVERKFWELDTYYIVKDNADLTNYSFDFLNFVKNIETTNSQLYQRKNRRGTDPKIIIHRGGTERLKLPEAFFDYIYDNPSPENDKWAIEKLYDYTDPNYYREILDVTFSGLLPGVDAEGLEEDAFIAIKGSNLQFAFELKRFVNSKGEKYMAIYNKGNEYLDSYDAVQQGGGVVYNVSTYTLPVIPIATARAYDVNSPTEYSLKDDYTVYFSNYEDYDNNTYN